MANNYATKGFATTLAGAHIVVHPGALRDTITDATLIALWPSNFTASAPAAGVGGITGIMAGYLAAYPRGEVK
jgi:hypothetical protein